MKKLLALLLLFVPTLFAQTPTASLTGYVQDPSGAALRSVKITVLNRATGIIHTATTDASGVYLILQLAPAPYDVTASAQGFQTQAQTGVVLQVDQRAQTNFTLKIGDVSESIEVSSQAALTETESSSIGAVIGNRAVLELPLNSRSFYSLPLLTPGVVQAAQNSTLGYRGGFNVAGSKETWNNFTLNGVDDNDEAINGPSYRPSIESIQEFKVLTGVYSAEYGRVSGGQVVIVTKSGSNRFHGDFFEFLRNQTFDAKNFFTPVGTTPQLNRNQYGGTFGGPIRKDKTFFFVNYEGLQLNQQYIALSTVPTPAMAGIATPGIYDFRSLLSLPTPVHVKNPFTNADFITPNVISGADLNGTGSGSVPILSTLGSQLGASLASFYPKATLATPTGQAPGNNYNFSQAGTEQLNQFAVRADHTFSAKDSVFANYNYFDDPTFVPTNNQCNSNNYIPGFGCTDGLTTQLAVVSETHVFKSNLLNEVRVNYERFRQSGVQQDVNANFAGIPGASAGNFANNSGVPNTTVTGFGSLGGATNMPQQRFDNTYQFIDSLSYTRGHHTLKVGADLRRADSIDATVYDGRGLLSFSGGSSGYSFADVLLGLPHSATLEPGAPTMRPYHNDLSFFGQDNWQYRPYLSFNLGLRWEYDSPIRDFANNLSGFNAANGTITWAGHNGASDDLYKKDFNNFGPRVGFSWQPNRTDSTVVRGGFGVFYNVPVLLQQFVSVLSQYPVRNPQTFTATTINPINLANAFPVANAPGSRTSTGINPNYATPYIDEWSLGLQRTLSKTAFLELTYLGSKGNRLPSEININQAVLGAGGTATENARRPYQTPFAIGTDKPITFGNVTYLQTEGNSYYHSLQAKLQQNYSNGLSYLVSYTYGRSIDEGAGGSDSSSDSSKALPQNSYAPNSERGLSDFDVRHRLVLSPVYDLPFGKKGRFLTDGWAAHLAGGWQLSSIAQWQTGRPFTIYYGTDNSQTGENADRPNLLSNPNRIAPHSVSKWFNTSAFASAPLGTFGNEGRNAVEGPGFVNVDASVAREISIGDGLSLHLRADSFNLANHPNFYNPNPGTDTFGSGSFGKLSQAYDQREEQFSLKLIF
jgi:hypothetical protein